MGHFRVLEISFLVELKFGFKDLHLGLVVNLDGRNARLLLLELIHETQLGIVGLYFRFFKGSMQLGNL